MRPLRASFAAVAALAFVAGVALAPLVEIHQRVAHAEPHGHHHAPARGADSSVADDHHHAHGSHEHAVLELTGALSHARPSDGAGAAPVVSSPFPAAAAVTADVNVPATTTRPPRNPHPLSISCVLRV